MRPWLALKLAGVLVASGAAIFAAFGWWNLRLQRKGAEDVVLQSADRISDVILRGTRYQMLRNDREALYQTIRDIGSEPGIRRIRIFNKAGVIRFSTDPAEVNRVVDKQAEACYGCHARAQPLVRLERPDRSRIFQEADGRRVLALIRPIDNAPGCSGGGCHAHERSQRVLGVIDAQLTLDSVDAQLAVHQSRLAKFTVGTLVALSLVSVLFVWIVVQRPLKELMKGTARVAAGDLSYRMPVQSGDELGRLADSFNRMTGDLAAAREEITAWAHTLEQRVEEKSRALERAQSTLLATEKMASIGKLAATVAHEVNNPLFGILTYAHLGQKELSKPDGDRGRVVENLGIIERESRRCGDIIRNLLSFSRQTPQKRAPTSLRELVDRSLQLVRHQLELKTIDLETHFGEDVEVDCDGGQIQQVLLALLVNATEAMPQGGRLVVTTEAEGDMARVRVRDSGGGIPQDVLPHIFEPFFTTKEDQQRNGLGLAVAWNIVQQHGGKLGVSSPEGQGAEFTVELPGCRRAAACVTGGPDGNG
jgi:two-component system NtrC family sensor kinase